VFHIAPASLWTGPGEGGVWAPNEGEEWSPPSLASEGFVHLSFADQLAGTFATHYVGAAPQRLLEVSEEGIAAELRVEPSRGGALFPHLYRSLRPSDVLRWWLLEQDAGVWNVPRLDADAGQDEPLGTPVQR
jgi:uncharacterized protein (DUF952 family)